MTNSHCLPVAGGEIYAGQSPRPWKEDFPGLREYFNCNLLGAYGVSHAFGLKYPKGTVHANAIGSSTHLFSVLFMRHLFWRLDNPWAPYNDTLIYSNGHGPEGMYQAAWRLWPEVIPEDWVRHRCEVLGAPSHPEGFFCVDEEGSRPVSVFPYRDFSGDLGGGVARAPGLALADRLQATVDMARDSDCAYVPHTWVVMSDGCVAEPEAWAAIHMAGQRELGNITFLVVDNIGSLAGIVEDRYRFFGSTVARAAACGLRYHTIFGHDMRRIDRVLKRSRATSTPTLIWLTCWGAYGLPSERQARAHGMKVSTEEMQHVLKQFGRSPYSDPLELTPLAREACRRRRNDLDAQGEQLEKRFPGCSVAPSFPISVPGFEDTLAALSDAADADELAEDFVPREYLRCRLLPRLQKLFERREMTPISVSADISTSTGWEMSKVITPFDDDPDAKLLDVGAAEALMAHTAEAINSRPYSRFRAFESTFLVYDPRTKPAMATALRRGTPYLAGRSHCDKGQGPDGPTHWFDTLVNAMRLGIGQFDYLCATPDDMVWALARMADALNGAHFMIYPRQALSIPRKSKEHRRSRFDLGVYPYASYGKDKPRVYVVGSGSGLSMGHELCVVLQHQAISSLLLNGFSISLFTALSWKDRFDVIPEGSHVVWIDPAESDNANVSGMLNTLPSRMIHAGVRKLRYPCLAAEHPELWKVDGLDTESLLRRTLRLLEGQDVR